MPAPQSAYIHVPFCRHRCGYCNFTLIAGRDDLIDDYLQALEIELSWLGTPRPVTTLFIGGGTPTHLDNAQLSQLLRAVIRWFPLTAGAEFSVEANPADVTPAKISLLAGHGVTRLNLGAQSWDTQKLQALERDHRAETIEQAVTFARPHLQSLGLDLIFAAPGETRDGWQQDLCRTLAMRPTTSRRMV